MISNKNKKRMFLLSKFLIILLVFTLSTEAHVKTINPSTPPSASISASKTVVNVGEEVTFSVSSNDGSGAIFKIVWNFHDGYNKTVTVNNQYEPSTVKHTFQILGEYLVSAVIFGEGNTNIIKTVKITVKNDAPIANFAIDKLTFNEDQNFTLDGSLSTDSFNADHLTYKWSMGDGKTYQGKFVTTSIAQAGSYPITLYVIDGNNALQQKTRFVTIVNQKPTAEIGVNKNSNLVKNVLTLSAYEDEPISFTGNSSSDTPSDIKTLEYYWTTSDGSVTKGKTFTHAFSSAGTYTVLLTVVDNNGARDTQEARVTVLNKDPTVAIQSSHFVTLDEGQTQIVQSLGNDTTTDNSTLYYNWDFNKTGQDATYSAYNDYFGKNYVHVRDNNNKVANDYTYFKVNNVAPKLSINKISIKANLTFRVTGEKYHDVQFLVYKDGLVVVNTSIYRIAGNPNTQSITIPITWDLTSEWTFQAIFTPLNDPINGMVYGSTPVSLIFTFSDNSTYVMKHTFTYSSSTTTPVLYWDLFLNHYFNTMLTTVEGQYFDPGTDNETIKVTYGNKTIVNRFLQNNDSWPMQGNFTFTYIFNDTLADNITLKIEDSDGASSQQTLLIVQGAGLNKAIKINNLAPYIKIISPAIVNEAENANFSLDIVDPTSSAYSVVWDNGLGDKFSGLNFSYRYNVTGWYVIQATVNDGYFSTTMGFELFVQNMQPGILSQDRYIVAENVNLAFNPTIKDTVNDLNSLRVYWNFGDGMEGTGKTINHIYSQDGMYYGHLIVQDNNGAITRKDFLVNVTNSNPTIEYTPISQKEGQVAIINAQVHDAPADELTMQYKWVFQHQLYTSKTFSTWQNDGNYYADLTVYDSGEGSAFQQVPITILNTPPRILAVNFIHYGLKGSNKIVVYGMDSFVDKQNLVYTWSESGKNLQIDSSGKINSTLEYNFNKTENNNFALTITLNDGTDSSTNNIPIKVTMDQDGDGLSDEFEKFTSNTNPNSPDTDHDFLSDAYELSVTNTNPNNADTDHDLLPDGYSAALGTGEVMLGTNPLNNDTDGDHLLDGVEVIGWTINVTTSTDNLTLNVNSNPLLKDTDGDGLTDGQEYLLHTNPRSRDTDGDGLSDYYEVMTSHTNPTKWDTDGDGLSDGYELQTHTYTYLDANHLNRTASYTSNPLKKDTDGDGINDYVEVMRLRTSPNNNDSDFDGVVDSQEQYTYHYDLGARHYVDTKTSTYADYSLYIPDTGNYIQFGSAVSFSKLNIHSSELTISLAVFERFSTIILGTTTIPAGKNVFAYSFDINNAVKNRYDNGSYNQRYHLLISGNATFIIDSFSIDITNPTNMLKADTDGDWLTDGQEMGTATQAGYKTSPLKSDTDGDHLSDYYEIMTSHTNPLLSDTDGDGVSDNSDLSPNGNLFLRIKINQANYTSSDADVKLAVLAKKSGSNAYITPFVKIVDHQTCVGTLICFTKRYSDFNSYFYFDVPDYQTTTTITFQLWENYYWSYLVGDKNRLEFTTDFTGSNVQWTVGDGYKTYINFVMERYTVNKVNTILVNDSNSYQNGHITNPTERYQAIYLNVNQNYGSFDRGINIILVPMSLYVNTQLHEDLEKQSIPDAISQASYYGTSTNSYISEHMEGIISRTDEISGYTAQQILDLVLNKAHGNTAYTATKLSDPLRIGLPSDIVLFIPWQGVSGTNLGSSSPSKNIIDTLGDLAINVVVTGVKLAVGGLIAVGNFLVHLGEAIVSWGISLVASAIGSATAVVKAAVSVAILVMAAVLKAVLVVSLTLFRLTMSLLINTFKSFIPSLNINISPLFAFQVEINNMMVGVSINLHDEYDNVLALNLPHLSLEFSMISNTGQNSGFTFDEGILDFWNGKIVNFPSTTAQASKISVSKFSAQKIQSISSTQESNSNPAIEFIHGLETSIGIISAWGFVAELIGFGYPETEGASAAAAYFAGLTLSQIALVGKAMDDKNFPLVLGVVFGMAFAAIVSFYGSQGKLPDWLLNLEKGSKTGNYLILKNLLGIGESIFTGLNILNLFNLISFELEPVYVSGLAVISAGLLLIHLTSFSISKEESLESLGVILNTVNIVHFVTVLIIIAVAAGTGWFNHE